MSDFAHSLMTKYGWTEGKGLGANETGRCEPIKVNMKNDLKGVGFDNSKPFTDFWWESAYKNAAANISVEDKCDGVKIVVKEKSKICRKKSLHATYRNFVQNGVFDDGVMKDVREQMSSEDEDENRLCDEELFKACRGRTAHKGARHGIKQSGKLARLEQYEKIYLEKLASSNSNLDKSSKSKRKRESIKSTQNSILNTVNKKAKKSKRKSKEAVLCSQNLDSTMKQSIPTS